MNKEYKDDPEYKKMFQAVIDANRIISRKKIINQIIYISIMVVVIAIVLIIIWNCLGIKDLFNTYNSIL